MELASTLVRTIHWQTALTLVANFANLHVVPAPTPQLIALLVLLAMCFSILLAPPHVLNLISMSLLTKLVNYAILFVRPALALLPTAPHVTLPQISRIFTTLHALALALNSITQMWPLQNVYCALVLESVARTAHQQPPVFPAISAFSSSHPIALVWTQLQQDTSASMEHYTLATVHAKLATNPPQTAQAAQAIQVFIWMNVLLHVLSTLQFQWAMYAKAAHTPVWLVWIPQHNASLAQPTLLFTTILLLFHASMPPTALMQHSQIILHSYARLAMLLACYVAVAVRIVRLAVLAFIWLLQTIPVLQVVQMGLSSSTRPMVVSVRHASILVLLASILSITVFLALRWILLFSSA